MSTVEGSLDRARELIWTSQPGDAERLLRDLRKTCDVGDALSIDTHLVEALTVQGRLTTADLDGLEAMARGGSSPRAAWALAVTARGWVQMGENARAEAAAREALASPDADVPTTINSLIAMSASLYDEARLLEAEELTRRAASLAEASQDPTAHRTQAHVFHGLCLMWLDDIDAARSAWLTGEELAARAGDTTALPLYFFLRGYGLFLEGRLSDAEAELETAGRVAQEIGALAYDVLFGATLARIKLHLAEFRKAGDLLAAAEAEWKDKDHTGDTGAAVFTLRAEVHEAEQNTSQALSDLLDAARIKGHHERALTRIALGPDIVRLAMAVGDTNLAREWVGHVAASADILDTSFARGASLRAQAWASRDPALLEEAVRRFRTTPRLGTTARAEEDLGELLDGDAAVRYCRNALAAYEQMGAARDAARVLARLRALGVRPGITGSRKRPPTGPGSLTRTEQRVAGLMLDGLSYPAIGKRLFISHRTVETHAAHIFQKLGIESRRDLPGVLDRTP